MNTKLTQLILFSKKYPLSRGMASYAIIWPLGSIIQQTIISKENNYDFAKVGRFCLYGSCFVAPTLHCWLKIANSLWPLNNVRSALIKAIVEQVTYTPFAMTSFYFGMTLLEGKTIEDGKNEVKTKFFPTYKIGACVWPVLQTFNYIMVKARNRVVFVSFCSLIWTSFLAYMKHLESHEISSTFQNVETDVTTLGPAVKSVHVTNETRNDKLTFKITS